MTAKLALGLIVLVLVAGGWAVPRWLRAPDDPTLVRFEEVDLALKPSDLTISRCVAFVLSPTAVRGVRWDDYLVLSGCGLGDPTVLKGYGAPAQCGGGDVLLFEMPGFLEVRPAGKKLKLRILDPRKVEVEVAAQGGKHARDDPTGGLTAHAGRRVAGLSAQRSLGVRAE